MASRGSFPSGGIFSLESVYRTAWISRLDSTSPGTTTGPPAPPADQPSRLSSLSPPSSFFAFVEWHE